MSENAATWAGPDQLRPLLRKVEDLMVHPHNPRRGNKEKIAASLEHHGQVKPIVVDRDGVILAGNQVFEVVVERIGWSHVAVVEYAGDDVAGYLLLVEDNDAADDAGYDSREAQVAAEGLRGMVEECKTALDRETDPQARDRLAEQMRGLENAAAVLGVAGFAKQAGGVIDPEAIVTDWCCPECEYEWRGNA